MVCTRLSPVDEVKATLHDYLRKRRSDLLGKLDGLGEYDVRRPMTATGTNLLGLVKHSAGTEAGYFGDTFGRPFGEPMPWMSEDAEPNSDMWASASESGTPTPRIDRLPCGSIPMATRAAHETTWPPCRTFS